MGNVTSVALPRGDLYAGLVGMDTWFYNYNSFSEVTTATDPLGHTTSYQYDSSGNLQTITTPSPDGVLPGSVTQFLAYDATVHLPTQIKDPLNNTTTIQYFTTGAQKGLIQWIQDANLKKTQYTYDARGNVLTITDANTKVTSFTYDGMNRVTQITYPTTPSATTVQFHYDWRGRRDWVQDQNANKTTYAYDDADRLLSVTDAQTPTAGVTRYGYDTESNLTDIWDASNNHTAFQYSGHQLLLTTFPSTHTESYQYDNNDNMLAKTDRKNQRVTYTPDYQNRLILKGYPNGDSVSYTYDGASRLTQVTDPTGTYTFGYDNMNRLLTAVSNYSFLTARPNLTVRYTYDAASNRKSLTDPESGVVNYTIYDVLNRLQQVQDFQSPAQTYTFGYDNLSRRASLARPNGINTTYTYNNVSGLLTVLHKLGTSTLDGATYTYDNAGNRLTRQDNRLNTTLTYTYDPVYELKTAKQKTTTKESYTYDAVGNRLSSLGVSPYAYNSSNELQTIPGVTYAYDNNGNLQTKTDATGATGYTWDYENRLTQVAMPGTAGTVNYKYDPFGRRVQKVFTQGANTTNYVYDGANVIEELDQFAAAVARYVQGLGIDAPLAVIRGGVTSYYELDGLNSVTSLSNSSGALANTYTYDSFGKVTASSGTITNPFRNTGRELDPETGLYYYRARYYDPGVGRFLTEDPLAFSAGPNFYSYVQNSPPNLVDPSGTDIAVIENGPTDGNPIGHTAIAISGYGVFSFGNNFDLGGSLSEYLWREAPRRDTTVYVIHTTPEQDRAALEFLRSFPNNHLHGGKDRVLDNCSIRSNDALSRAGIPTNFYNMSSMGPMPGNQLYVPGSAGSRALDVGAQVYSLPKNWTAYPRALGQFEPRTH